VPTAAITGPHQLDARRCISYLTIEHKGSIPLEFRSLIGDRIYGCDDCLEACPWNRFAQTANETAFAARPFVHGMALRDFLALDEDGFRALFRKSPIKRLKRRGFLRNVCVALAMSAPRTICRRSNSLLRTRTADRGARALGHRENPRALPQPVCGRANFSLVSPAEHGNSRPMPAEARIAKTWKTQKLIVALIFIAGSVPFWWDGAVGYHRKNDRYKLWKSFADAGQEGAWRAEAEAPGMEAGRVDRTRPRTPPARPSPDLAFPPNKIVEQYVCASLRWPSAASSSCIGSRNSAAC
jgi:hypothetical protein